MSSHDDNSLSNQTDKLTVITDSDGIPVKVDNNPAHFDGFVQEIEDFSRRTGVFLPYFEHGMVMRGSKTITDSAASVPFLMGMVTNAKVYSARDPCPPTAKRVADHNDAMEASTPKRSTFDHHAANERADRRNRQPVPRPEGRPRPRQLHRRVLRGLQVHPPHPRRRRDERT